MQNDPTFTHVREFINVELDHIEKTTEEALETIRAYLSDPDADTFDLRLMTLIGRAKSYGRAWTHIEEGLQRLQKKVEEERDR